MNNIEEKLIELSKYNIGFNIINNFYIINISYPKHWCILKPQNDIYYLYENNISYYYTNITKNSLNSIYDIINSTIEYNIDKERKIMLLNNKIKELTEIFDNTSYKELESLTFTFKKKRKIKKEISKNKESINNKNDELNVIDKNTSNEETINEEINKTQE